ncbi:hypothetical protein ABK040_008180 [Willaertia magna]
MNNKSRLATLTDFQNFDYHFEAVLDNAGTFDCLTKYLETSLNKESAQFLKALNDYRKIKFEKKRVEISFDIYKTFIADNAPQQINLNGSIKKKIEAVLYPLQQKSELKVDNTSSVSSTNSESSRSSIDSDNSTNSSSSNNKSSVSNNNTDSSCSSPNVGYYKSFPRNLYDEAESVVLYNLKENHFKQFIDSKDFLNYVQTQPVQLLFDIGTPKESSSLCFVENLSDLKSQYWTWSDFKFLKQKFLETDEKEWEMISKGSDHKCFMSKEKFEFGDCEGTPFFKFEIEFPYGIAEVMNTMFELEYLKKLDPNIDETQFIKYNPKEVLTSNSDLSQNMTHFASAVVYESFKLGWPITDRDFLSSVSAVHLKKENAYMMGKKTCECTETYKPKKGAIRSVCLGGWMFLPMGLKKTKYIQLYFLDFKGKIPRGLVEDVYKKRAKGFYKLGMKYLKESEKKGFVCKNDFMKCLKSIDENGPVDL